VAVDDDGAAAVLGGPVVADGQAELVGLAGGLAEQGELADRAGAAALQWSVRPAWATTSLPSSRT
jgi:hypothetical protein